MYFRLMVEALLGTAPRVLGVQTMEHIEKKVAGGKALSVRSMVARQMVRAHLHRKLKEFKTQ